MAVKDTLAAIQAETERRKQIWTQLQQIANDAVKAMQKEATKRGVKSKKWLDDGFSGDSSAVVFEGKAGDEKDLIIFVLTNGTISCNQKEYKANLVYDGYPDLIDAAAKPFEKAVVETLLENLIKYCDSRKTK